MVADDSFNPSDVVTFEWDTGNLHKNRLKHNVTFKECEEIFYNQPAIHSDKRHSKQETRFQALGQTHGGRQLFIVFTLRNNKVRVISARDQSKKERITYKEVRENG